MPLEFGRNQISGGDFDGEYRIVELLPGTKPKALIWTDERIARWREIRPGLWVMNVLSMLFFVFYPY